MRAGTLKSKKGAKEPKLLPHLIGLWETFWTLSRSRPIASGMVSVARPIDFVTLDTYARRFSIEGEHYHFWLHCITFLDSLFVEHVKPKETKPPGGKTKPRTRGKR